MVALEETFHIKNLPYEELLMADGAYVDEVIVARIAEFLEDVLSR